MLRSLNISRRDFLNGVALGVAGGALSPLELLAMPGRGYPPALTGLRGSHDGSFEVAHALAWGGARWDRPADTAEADYGLVVIGGGISGLAAAFLYRQRVGADASILVLDNHDDLGGHARRNEFDVDGRKLICYGGSQSLDNPGKYSAAAKKLLRDVAVDPERFHDYFDREFYAARGLERGLYFGQGVYGRDVVAPLVLSANGSDPSALDAAIARFPIPPAARRALARLLTTDADFLGDRSRSEKIRTLRGMTYSDYLRGPAGMPEDVVLLYRDQIRGWWGVGWDALSALEAYRLRQPGVRNAGIGRIEGDPPPRDEPYIYHFPDGNAGVARALLRRLIPAAVPGNSMEDLVRARVDYDALDLPESPVRIRLESTAVRVEHTPDGDAVDVSYVNGGSAHRVRGRHAVLACYNDVIPHLCPELPAAQKAAMGYAAKVPLVYISVAIRRWQAFADSGYHSFYLPQADKMHSFGMDFPVSMGGYRFTDDPAQPTVVHGSYVPAAPDRGLSAREQHVAGRKKLYELRFDDFERDVVAQLDGALGPAGFDAERDIAAITVNRWPHGYAYEYNDYSDPPDWNRYKGPHIVARAPLGRISIANSDAEAYAFVDGAIDAADRAVDEQLG